MDTIFALSSGAPPAGIAVVRVSGEGAFAAVQRLAGTLPPARRASVRALRNPADGGLLDRALVLCFPGPASATGEDLAELHLHGGRAVVRAIEAALGGMPGLRMAEAGEFTRRALHNGRLDLSEAEGLGDLLAAETETQRRVALRSAEGAVRSEVDGWTDRLLRIAAQVEAMLDHVDEDDVAAEAESLASLQALAGALGGDVGMVATRPPVERLRDGLRVVLAGPPNAGKSTLLNALVGREAAITSSIAGTTRDRVEAPVTRNGLAYVLTDTAGLNQTPGDAIEQIGIARAEEAIRSADILLWLGDDAPPEHPARLWLHPRADQAERGDPGGKDLALSAVTGEGMSVLWDRIEALAASLVPAPDMVALNRRQRDLCIDAAAALTRAAVQHDPLLFAEEVRAAQRAFDAVTGRAGVEAMLDALFSRFCIGK
ncbi:tRNA uridine-5-carboxymethylaminomethyl(34) synthesis GTPase MnmE [Sphingomonas sp. S2-65]|uniref:tRNA uridine-5-carboxymethylaminomethyl(34) synthesis GTPase MnmE n=1 Tax=Sphingomonas sp. S2-65 TaxID=2903960 RepID=UPI001F3CC02B|nr:tRNA uridine-5-carboxymethylaminomethyl(34) synthesis GTPase MnmE [Sphingomonas sp. S2-65]UYY57322.1 tRNA uridine-5-carboxymethylaminomethyl(34) synthesis GTPase MnmE [Sphingomonas sp. S2-65]